MPEGHLVGLSGVFPWGRRGRPSEISGVDPMGRKTCPDEIRHAYHFTLETNPTMSKPTSNDGLLATISEAPTSRRSFLRSASLTAVGGALVACGTGAAPAAAKQVANVSQAGGPKPGATGGTMGPHDTAAGPGMSAADAMD